MAAASLESDLKIIITCYNACLPSMSAMSYYLNTFREQRQKELTDFR